MEKWELRPPLPQKPLNRSSPKFAWVITSGTPTLCKISLRYDYPPSPPNMRKCASSESATFFRSSDSLQPRPLHRLSRSIRQMTRFQARMCFLGVPKGVVFYNNLQYKRQDEGAFPSSNGVATTGTLPKPLSHRIVEI